MIREMCQIQILNKSCFYRRKFSASILHYHQLTSLPLVA
jgi:hypothetical protein